MCSVADAIGISFAAVAALFVEPFILSHQNPSSTNDKIS